MNIEQFIQDDDFETKHEDLDNDIKATFAPLTEKNILSLGPHVLSHIVRYSENRLLQLYYDSILLAEDILATDGTLRQLMLDGRESGFKPVRLYKPLRAYIPPGRTLVDDPWDAPFVGGAADALWAHICYIYSPSLGANSPDIAPSSSSHDPPNLVQRDYYPQSCAVLQSSGMGKSRAVDEISKAHFVIPVILREPQSSGHPPSDLPAFNFLTESFYTKDAFVRSCAFLHELFCEAATVVRGFGASAAAHSFREYMTKDMVFREHGRNRAHFYQNVVDNAKDRTSTYSSYFRSISDPSGTIADGLLLDDTFPLRQAFRELCEVIRSRDESALPPSEPLVIVAFDEVQNLARTDDHWRPNFRELRRAMQGLRLEPFFALFLSLSGAAFDVAPTPAGYAPTNPVHVENVVSPFCELGFDQLAKPLDFAQAVNLSQVSSLDHLASYGRPLWNSYAAAIVIQFAAFKLLGGYAQTPNPLMIEQQFACLAQRIPIQFLSETSQISSDQQKEQVCSHLRVLLKVDDTFETMVTLSPSEPILSEAAYSLMTSGTFRPAQAMQNILNGFAVDKSNLEELLVALLFIIARDKAVGPPDCSGQPLGSRWCSLPHILSCLFCPPPDAPDPAVVNIQASFGWRFSGGNTGPVQLPLANVFEESKVYFTHFIKAHEERVAGVEYLMRLMARGAALLCATGQDGVNGIIPFLLRGDEIRQDNIGVIMFHCTNDPSFTDDPEEEFVRAMDPGICNLADVPVIRIVFALAAPRPALKLVHHTKLVYVRKSYVAYDFWVAGFSPDVLLPIKDEPDAWNDILRASNRWGNVYASGLENRKLRMAMNPGVGASAGFWGRWCDVPQDV